MKTYELTYLISSNLSQKEIESLSQKINSLLQEKGGIVIREQKGQEINLGYEIKKQRNVILKVLEFSLEPPNLKNIEENLKEIAHILRYMILVQKQEPKKAPLKKPVKPTIREKKVELEEIEKKIEEILG